MVAKFCCSFPLRLFLIFCLLLSTGTLFAQSRFDDLYKPTDMALHPNGDLYITDSGNQRVVVLDGSEGRELLRSFGQKGMGPGEFQNPSSIAFLGPDDILISDNFSHKVLVFSSDGNFKRKLLQTKHSIGQMLVVPELGILTTDQDGKLFSISIGDSEKNYPIRLYSQEGSFIKGIGDFQTHEIPLLASQMNHGSIAWHRNTIYFASYIQNQLTVFGNNGKKTFRYAPAFPPREPEGKMKEMKQPDGSSVFKMNTTADIHCFDLEILDDSRILMLRASSQETDGIVPSQLVVLSHQGKLIKTLPGTFRASRMVLLPNKKHVFLLDEDDNGWFVHKQELNL